MGREQRLREEREQRIRAVSAKVTEHYLKEGKIIAAGWAAFAHMCIPADAPAIQHEEMRKAFMAGAQHLWASIMVGLSAGDEASPEDEKRMELIGAELDAYAAKLQADLMETKGSA